MNVPEWFIQLLTSQFKAQIQINMKIEEKCDNGTHLIIQV